MRKMQSRKHENTGGVVTIKDISTKLNVSATSVHRALAGKEGVGDALREQILATAEEMGYERNYVASSIKRKPYRIAIVLPQDRGLYYAHMWRGVRDIAREARVLNVEIEEFVCTDELHQAEILKQIAEGGPKKYAGVVTFCFVGLTKTIYQLIRLTSMGICTVLIDDEVSEIDGIHSIPANSVLLGETAAELAALITPDHGTVLISEGRKDSMILSNKVNAFTEYLNREKPALQVVPVTGFSRKPETDAEVYQNVVKALEEYPDTVLYYALTSADNRQVVDAIHNLGLDGKIRVIATDLNSESAQYLRNGQVNAVINQGSYAKGQAGMNLVLDSVVKHQNVPQKIDCPIDVVLKSNLKFFGF